MCLAVVLTVPELRASDAAGRCSCSPVANVSRVLADLKALRQIGGAADHPLGVRRTALTAEDLEARRWIAVEMEREAGLKVHMDGLANYFGICEAASMRRTGSMVLMGSHTDTQPEGGWLDGALGVVYALEAARAMREAEC